MQTQFHFAFPGLSCNAQTRTGIDFPRERFFGDDHHHHLRAKSGLRGELVSWLQVYNWLYEYGGAGELKFFFFSSTFKLGGLREIGIAEY